MINRAQPNAEFQHQVDFLRIMGLLKATFAETFPGCTLLQFTAPSVPGEAQVLCRIYPPVIQGYVGKTVVIPTDPPASATVMRVNPMINNPHEFMLFMDVQPESDAEKLQRIENEARRLEEVQPSDVLWLVTALKESQAKVTALEAAADPFLGPPWQQYLK